MSILPMFSHDLGVSIPMGGHAISAYALGVVVGAPLLAVLGARTSRRTMLLLLLAWFALANLLSATAPSFGWLLAFRFLSGLPHGAYFGFAALVAAGLVDSSQRATAIGRVMTGLTVATIAGVPMANWRRSCLVGAPASASSWDWRSPAPRRCERRCRATAARPTLTSLPSWAPSRAGKCG